MSLGVREIVTTDDRERLHRRLRCIAEADDHVGVGVDGVLTPTAPQDVFSHKTISREGGRKVNFPIKGAFTPGAREVRVEAVLRISRTRELVLIPFDSSPCEFGIHLFEDTHEVKVAECPQQH